MGCVFQREGVTETDAGVTLTRPKSPPSRTNFGYGVLAAACDRGGYDEADKHFHYHSYFHGITVSDIRGLSVAEK
jgi:hypothetical protein